MSAIAAALTAVISTHNGKAKVLVTLEHLVSQDPPDGGFDVVVVADGCTDGTGDVVRSRSWPVPVRVVEQPQGGLAAARNRGARETTADLLLFMDDDMELQPGFVTAVVATAADGADVVIPAVGPLGHGTDMLAEEQRRGLADELRVLRSGRVSYDLVHFQAGTIRRSWHERLGGFDKRYTAGGRYGNEDIEFGHRLLTAGADVRHCPDAVARTSEADQAVRALRRTRQVGPNDVLMVRTHPELAYPVFGRKLDNSRIHRALAKGVSSRGAWLPLLVRLGAPFGPPVVTVGRTGRLPYALWRVIRSAVYWASVRDAGGADVIDDGRRAASRR